MQYSEALAFIHGIARQGSKLGLERVQELLERLQRPQDKLKFVHVAGTNGKGSTCTMLSYILKTAGYKTGLYISPFVLDFRERIQLNNEMIPEHKLVESTVIVKRVWDEMNAEGNPPTEFEVVLAIALDYYVRMGCDIAVLEVGLGGRLDATNAIDTPLCSVITNIGIDHTEFLGDTIAQITAEKCGIIKDGGVTISYPRQLPEALAVIERFCQERENRLIMPKSAETLSMDISGSVIKYDGIEVHIPLSGGHQIYNAATVIEAARALRRKDFAVTDANIASGIAQTTFPSRLERLCDKPLVLLDGAHNLLGAQVIAESLKMLNGRKIHGLAAFMRDKDAGGIFREILPYCSSVTVYSLSDNPRAMPAEEAASLAKQYCGAVYVADTLETALTEPFSRCRDDDVLLIFGSFFFASEIRPLAKRLFGARGM